MPTEPLLNPSQTTGWKRFVTRCKCILCLRNVTICLMTNHNFIIVINYECVVKYLRLDKLLSVHLFNGLDNFDDLILLKHWLVYNS